MTTILKQTKLEPLKERRKQNRLILFCNGIHHLVEIPTDNLQRPLRTTKNMHSQHYSTLKDILWWITFRDGLPVMSDLESTGVCC
jgi:hypothetical protein